MRPKTNGNRPNRDEPERTIRTKNDQMKEYVPDGTIRPIEVAAKVDGRKDKVCKAFAEKDLR